MKLLEIFRNWVNVLLCLGIFMVIVKLFLPKNNLRKYVLSLLSVIAIISIVSPVIDVFKSGELERSIKSVISSIDETDTQNLDTDSLKKAQEDSVKSSFIQSIKIDITNKLSQKGIDIQKIEIFMNDNYDIEKIEISIGKIKEGTSIENVNTVVKYINEEYQIDYSKIVVVEEG